MKSEFCLKGINKTEEYMYCINILSSGLLGKIVFRKCKINCHLQNIRIFYSCNNRTKMYSCILSEYFLFSIILNCNVIPNNLTQIPTYDRCRIDQCSKYKCYFLGSRILHNKIYNYSNLCKTKITRYESASEHTLMRALQLKNDHKTRLFI